MQARVLRFQDEFGHEHFGVAEDEFRARILERSDKTGKMEPSNVSVGVMEILPPLDPVAVYGVGLNYRDHASETGKEVPRLPSETHFFRFTCQETSHNKLTIHMQFSS